LRPAERSDKPDIPHPADSAGPGCRERRFQHLWPDQHLRGRVVASHCDGRCARTRQVEGRCPDRDWAGNALAAGYSRRLGRHPDGAQLVGNYGFLAKAHIASAIAETAVAVLLTEIDGRIAAQTTALANIDRQLGQIDGAIEKAMAQGKVNAARRLRAASDA